MVMIREHHFERHRVLLIDAGYFLTREIHRALEKEGHQVIPVPFHFDTSKPLSDGEIYTGFLKALIDLVESQRPTLLFTINHLGFDARGRLTELLEALELPAAVWYVDSPRYIFLDNYDNISDRVGIFLWDDSYHSWLERIGFRHIHTLPLATDPDVFRPIRTGNATALDAPLVFAGDSMKTAVEESLMELPDPVKNRFLNENDAAFAELSKEFCAEISSARSPDRLPAWKVLERCRRLLPSDIVWRDKADPFLNLPEDLPNGNWLKLESSLTLLATKLHRHRFIGKLAESPDCRSFVIYGDDGWEKVVNGQTQVLPPVDYYEELPRVYASAFAVVNLTGYQMPRALNQRCYDVPAAGGFLLTDRQAALAEQFAPDEDIVCFDSAAELIDKLRFYRNHPDLRAEIIERGRRRVLELHTYRHRVREMLRMMEDWFGKPGYTNKFNCGVYADQPEQSPGGDFHGRTPIFR